jgi:predicted transcriptional regulator
VRGMEHRTNTQPDRVSCIIRHMRKLPNINVLEEVIWQLNNTRAPFTKIAREVGVRRRYLYKIKTGETPNPQFNELNMVYQYFVKTNRIELKSQHIVRNKRK